jgi:hypothetical protein
LEGVGSPSNYSILSYSNSILSKFNFGGGDSRSAQGPETPGTFGKPLNNSKPPPPPSLLQIIKEKAKALGFYLDDPAAGKIAEAIPDSSWFTNKHSIIVFAAQKIGEAYDGTPKAEQKRLFFSALTSWEDLKDEYPDWLAKKVSADERAALEKLKKTPPTECPNCGGAMNGPRCPACNGWVEFNEDAKAWEYQEPFDFKASLKNLKASLSRPKAQSPPEKTCEDIDF